MIRTAFKPFLGSGTAVLLAATVLAGCTDTVFRDRPPFNPPPDQASGFLGYYNANQQQTTCGNCHVDHQRRWVQTAHADAYGTLAANPGAQGFCYECHTVSPRGNDVNTPAGYNVESVAAYHDVQCESCHGPGLTHVETPDVAAPPLARAEHGDSTTGCASCHNGSHHPFAEEWASSRHAHATTQVIEDYEADPVGRASCMACHEGRNVLKAWGVQANYVEKNDAIDTTSAFGVECVVCHDPHSRDNPGQLRFPVDDPSLENNLCMKCHARRFDPAVTSSRGPHAPQGAVLIGTAGWWPPGYDTTASATTHGDPSANPRYCAGCHVNRYTVTDQVTGQFQFQSVGHLFRPIPCLDPVSGQPVADNTCSYAAAPTRTWASCVSSGCHSNEGAVIAAFNSNRSTIAVLADLLWVDTDGNENVNAGDTGYLTQVPGTEFSTSDGKITVAEGSLFNMRLVGEGRYANGDKSIGVHNPFLSRALLAASISAMQDTYGLPAPPAPLQALIRESLAKVHKQVPPAVSAR